MGSPQPAGDTAHVKPPDQLVALAPPTDTDPAQVTDNPLLARYRGHRTRTWGDAEALHALQLVAEGHSTSYALDTAGIPRSALWSAHRPPTGDALDAAITSVRACEGADWYEDRLREVASGEGDHRVVQALVAGLKLRGRLQPLASGAPGAASAIALQIVVVQQQHSIDPAHPMQAVPPEGT